MPTGAATGYDVLQRHRTTNRAPKLTYPRSRDSEAAREVPDDDDDDDDDEEPATFGDETEGNDEDASDGSGAPCRRAPRHSRKAFNPRSDDPSQVAFYPATWQEVLGAAKIHWRVRVATEWGFPKIRERKSDVLACLTQAITEYENENGSLERGMWSKSCCCFAILT